MSNLLYSPILLGLMAFLAGGMIATLVWVVGRGKPARQAASPASAGTEHRIRALEADLRIATQNAQDLQAELATVHDELKLVNEESIVLRKRLERRDSELSEAQKAINEECIKTARLRKELTGRAEETIRAQVQIKNIETELDVAQAGSEVVAEQLQRLAAEREDLTDRLRALSDDTAESDDDRPAEKTFADEMILDS